MFASRVRLWKRCGRAENVSETTKTWTSSQNERKKKKIIIIIRSAAEELSVAASQICSSGGKTCQLRNSASL